MITVIQFHDGTHDLHEGRVEVSGSHIEKCVTLDPPPALMSMLQSARTKNEIEAILALISNSNAL